jgi:membrane-associated protease RseP (regulator of RpoE activity)
MDTGRHHFRIFGTPVRVEPAFLFIMALMGLNLAEEDWRYVLIWVGVAFVSILVHELGHALTLKAFGQPSEIHLQGFGGVTLSQRRLTRNRSVAVSLAGSLTALALLWLPARTLNGSDWILDQSLWVQNAVLFAAYVNLWWSVANLLPIRPLDGGNVATELFGIHTARRLSLVVAAAGGIWALRHEQTFAGIFALLLAFQAWQEISTEGRAV